MRFQVRDVLLALLDQRRALLELLEPDRGLDFAQPEIEPDHIDEVGHALRADHRFRMVADELQPFGQLVVVRGAHSAFAGVDVLVVVQAEHADVAERSDRPALVGGERRLRAVFDDLDAVTRRQFHDRVHVSGLAENVDDDDRLGRRRYLGRNRLGRQRVCNGIDIGEDRNGIVNETPSPTRSWCKARR